MCSGVQASCPPQAPSSVEAAWALGDCFPKWRKYVGDSGAPGSETHYHLQRIPTPPGALTGAVCPQRYWPREGQGHVLSTCSCHCFSYHLILSSLLLLLSCFFLISSLGLCCSLCTLFICSLFFRQWRFYAITDLNKTAFPFMCVMNSAPVSAVWSEKCSCF